MIKTGRFKGQPEWMPDCEIWTDNDDVYYKINISETDCLCFSDNMVTLHHIKRFEYVNDPVYKNEKRRPDDIIVAWKNKACFVATMWYKDYNESDWDSAIVMPEEYVGKRINYRKEFWEKVNAEVIK